jgi:hypothetical protein
MAETGQKALSTPQSTPSIPAPVAPLLMMAFWMLVGGAAGIRLAQSLWQFLEWDTGAVSIAVPVGGAVGAGLGALLGLITNPRLLLLLMAASAGASAGAVVGKVPWGGIGEISGQVLGAMLGGTVWGIWLLFFECRKGATQPNCAPEPVEQRAEGAAMEQEKI